MKIIFTSILFIVFAFLFTYCSKKQEPVLPVDYTRNDTITYEFLKNIRNPNNVDSISISMSLVKYSLVTYRDIGVEFDTSFTMLIKDFPNAFQFNKPFILKNSMEESYRVGLGFNIRNQHIGSFSGSYIGNTPKPKISKIISDY